MIDFALSEEQQAALDTAERFAREQLAPSRREAEAARALPADTLALAAVIGVGALDLPSELDGAGLGTLAQALVTEALAAADAGGAWRLVRQGTAQRALLAAVAAAHRAPRAAIAGAHRASPTSAEVHAAGDAAAAAAEWVRELLGSARNALVVADLDGAVAIDGARVRGSLPWVPADAADAVVLIGRERVVVLREGLSFEPVAGSALQAAGASALQVDAPVAFAVEDAGAARGALAHLRLALTALMVGAMRQSCEQSRDYAVDRVAFGKPIAHHQALAFLIVEMRMALDTARGLLHEAAWRADVGRPFEAEAAAAFAEAAEGGMFVGPNGVQIYGAAGFMRDGPVEKPMRELRTLSLMAGGVDAARDDARAALGTPFLADAAEAA